MNRSNGKPGPQANPGAWRAPTDRERQGRTRRTAAAGWTLACLLGVVASVPARVEPTREDFLNGILLKSLNSWHYHPDKLDDKFSAKVFKLYLKRIDPQKKFLLQSDVDSLKPFQDRIDDELKRGTFGLVDAGSALLRRRVAEAETVVQAIAAKPLDFTADDSLETDPQKVDFCKTGEQLRERWLRIFKYQVLTRMAEAAEAKEKEKGKDKEPKARAKGKKPAPAQPAESEPEARAQVAKSLKRSFDRLLKEDRDEQVAGYFNCVANSYDPHTEYFKPEAKEEFDITMTGTLEGIGAVLKEEDGFIKVVSVVPGSAAWRQKELKAEDKILKVAQGDGESVDLVDASVNEAVKLIRGKKGTVVKLTVRHPDGRVAVIPIVRDVVVVEDSYARSAILANAKAGKRFGYISLPAFYRDFNHREARNASGDVKAELDKLRAQKVDGVILDLRNNGGGALDDAVKMAGLFFKTGPVVQIKDQRGEVKKLEDSDPDVSYAGPVVVLINTFSASASEIVAAALQDYGRAVILGADTSFGKGTVQTMVDLDNYLPPQYANYKPLGSLKLTIQKFYRINGGSTQYKGVVPDILIPDAYTSMDVGEKYLDYPLPFDTVPAQSYARWTQQKLNLAGLRQRSEARLKGNPAFKVLSDNLVRFQKRRDETKLALQLARFEKDREEVREEADKFDSLQREPDYLKVLDDDPSGKAPADSETRGKQEKWHQQLGKDLYIGEAMSVLLDILSDNKR